MTPADYKTAHEALGLTTAFLAERTGVVVGRIWAYEHHDRTRMVPPPASKVMRELMACWDAAADRLAREARPGEFIPRQTTPEAFYAAVPELDGWPMEAQGPLLAEVQRRVQLPIEYEVASR